MRKIPLVYGSIAINDVDPRKESPFNRDFQDFQHNMRNLEGVGSRTTNGGWTMSTTITTKCLNNGTIGGKCTYKG